MPEFVLKKGFVKKARKLIKNSRELDDKLETVLELLQNDPFTPSLKTHPLSGKLKGKHGCSLTEKLRIVFKLSDNKIHLLNIGPHDEVY